MRRGESAPRRSSHSIPPARSSPSAPRIGAIPSTAFWQAPSADAHEPRTALPRPHPPGPGACELGQSRLPGLTPEWGHTLARITPITGAQGELLLSCIDTHYYLHGWPLTAAVLLNAQHPGAAPGPLPGTMQVVGATGIVDYPGAGLSGRRIGNAWLVVSGGSGTAQRLRVLAALHITQLKLTR